MCFGLLIWLVSGIVIGSLARWLVPGPDPATLVQTWLIGIGGSLVGGIISFMLFKEDSLIPGFFMSIIGAIIILVIMRLVRNNSSE